MKKLYRSRTDQVFAGVLGGLGEYTDTDPTLWRLGYVLIAFISHLIPAIFVYIIAVVIIPLKPENGPAKEAEYTEKK